MNKIQYIGIKEKDKSFRVVNQKFLTDELKRLQPGRYRLTIERWRKKKSNSQLGYLFACVYPLFMQHLIDAGWEITSIDEVDAFCKSRFADTEIINRNSGEIILIPALKRDFTTVDLMTYIDKIRDYDAEYLGGYIPEPEQQIEIQIK
jgi:hypothetical protein